jgi:ABC-2 type transport system permease protein
MTRRSARLVIIHARASALELARYPAYLVPTLIVPSVFFLFFVSPGTPPEATVRMATFAGFATIGVAFFQFGVGIAVDRASPWEAYLRTLPVGPAERLAARLLSAVVFSSTAAAILVGVALATTDASLPAIGWMELAAALLAGTVPFALLGIALGYWAPVKGALPIANLLYLVLSYAGGLWVRPGALPHPLGWASRLLPTRAFADALAAIALGRPCDWGGWAALAGFTGLFAGAAAAGYRRDEGRRFR